MNSKSYTNTTNSDKIECTQIVQKRVRSMMQFKNYDWKMSYNLINTDQDNIILRRKATHILFSYKEQLPNICPANLKILKDTIPQDKRPDDDLQSKDVDFEEHEAHLDERASDLSTMPKISTWNEYKKLLELSKSRPDKPCTKPYITDATFLPKIRIDQHVYL
ncbi:uncharacterized protein LOC113464865 [Ceratina calcarata]|uniref:Uncharacterized protein LOC113464865 n=1 Tax=Ceratina calcarata TaxID=156304 RepID=A0AAJ7S7Y8_9HYME|nr:uncharacterized protein LOC113464865 [Ceratina calcarata]